MSDYLPVGLKRTHSIGLLPCQLLLVMPPPTQAADSITSLDVSDNNLVGDAANLTTGLPRLAALKGLTMSSCSLTSWPLAGLSPGCLNELHTLDLRGNAFGRCPVNALAACPQLRHLDVSGKRGKREHGQENFTRLRRLSMDLITANAWSFGAAMRCLELQIAVVVGGCASISHGQVTVPCCSTVYVAHCPATTQFGWPPCEIRAAGSC